MDAAQAQAIIEEHRPLVDGLVRLDFVSFEVRDGAVRITVRLVIWEDDGNGERSIRDQAGFERALETRGRMGAWLPTAGAATPVTRTARPAPPKPPRKDGAL